MKLNNALAYWTCIVGVVVTNESYMASFFPEADNLNGNHADMCSNVAGPSSSASGNCLSLDQALTISPTTSTTGRNLGFARDYNSHTVFRGVSRHFVWGLF